MPADATDLLDDLDDEPRVIEQGPRPPKGSSPAALARDRAQRREVYLRKLDEPRHALEYGGETGHATIRGVPTGSPGGQGEAVTHSRRIGVVSEPVPVLLRDAVTIDTAVRLTGVKRETLQRAAMKGILPALKLGPSREPYLVRLRDVVTYLVTMWTFKRARNTLNAGDFEYVGFPAWLVEEVAAVWPAGTAFTPGAWEPRNADVKRGGRPQGYSPGRGWTKAGKKLGRPFRDPSKNVPPATLVVEEKRGSPERDHSQAAPAEQKVDPTTLPKWHPLWRRSQEDG